MIIVPERLTYRSVRARLVVVPLKRKVVSRVGYFDQWLEWQDWADPILEEPFRIENGRLAIPDKPGCGIAWNEKAVERYSLR